MEGSISDDFVLFVFLSLLLIICANHINKNYKVPISPLLLVFGIMLRVIGSNYSNMKSMVNMVDGVGGSTIQLGIVPAIIFEAAFLTDWYRLKKEIGQVIPMASSVVILCSVFTALIIKSVLQYDFSWNECLLLGLVLSATDHVAVKSNLYSVNSDSKFERLLGGETLMNEATVLVIFKVLVQSIETDDSVAELFGYFCRLTFGGFCLGIVSAVFMGLALERIVNDYIQETNLTFVVAYLLFWTCNYSDVQFSGALAVMTYGLYMSAYGKILISPMVQSKMHKVWDIYSKNVQNIIFVIAGMLLQSFLVPGSLFGFRDFLFVIVLFLLLHGIRVIIIFVHYPILSRYGSKINAKEALVISIAGLKGVISSVLALIVFNDSQLDYQFRSTLLFFTINIVGLSILFDSILLKVVIHKFDMDVLSKPQENVLLGVTTTILNQTSKKIMEIKQKVESVLIKWDEVLAIAGANTILHEIMKKSRIGRDIITKNPYGNPEILTEIYSKELNFDNDIILIEVRIRFYSILKQIYWNCFESGQCRGPSALELIDSCNKALDNEMQEMKDWDGLEIRIYSEKKMSFLKKYTTFPIIGRVVRRIIYDNIISAYDIAHTFLRAHVETEKIMKLMDIDEDMLEFILEEANLQVIHCQDFIKNFITDSYPEIIADVQSKMACYMLLNSQRRIINQIFHQGLVKELEHKHLLSAADENFKLLKFMAKPKIPTLQEMLKSRFKKSNNKEIKKIIPYIEEKHYQPDTYLFEADTPIEGAYLIFSGSVDEYGEILSQNLGISNIAGAYTLTDVFEENYITTAKTRSVVIAAFIPTFALTSACFIEDVYKEAAKHIVIYQKDLFGLGDALDLHIETVIEKSSVWYLQPGSPINLKRGAMVLKGKVAKNKEIYSVLRPTRKILESIDEAILLIFPPHFGSILRQYRSITHAFANYFIKHQSISRLARNDTIIAKIKLKDIEETSDFED
jgi:NhaP-type Na+/H+ or K+/H+ antiporter/CRP-like cAMP-binding protein